MVRMWDLKQTQSAKASLQIPKPIRPRAFMFSYNTAYSVPIKSLPNNAFVMTGEAYIKAIFLSSVVTKTKHNKVLAASYSDIRWLVLPLKNYLPRHAFFNSEAYFKLTSLSLVFASWLYPTVSCPVSLLRKKCEATVDGTLVLGGVQRACPRGCP